MRPFVMYALSFLVAGTLKYWPFKPLFGDSAYFQSVSFAKKESEGQGCPFCRAEIKGTELVVVDPFEPGKNNIRSVLYPANNSSLNISSSSSLQNDSANHEEVLDGTR